MYELINFPEVKLFLKKKKNREKKKECTISFLAVWELMNLKAMDKISATVKLPR